MQRISLVDETFDLNFTLEYILSIQLSLDGFSFSILDTIQNKVVYLFHQELFDAEPEFLLKRLKTIYEESDLLELAFKKTKVLISAPGRTSLIPEEFFNEDSVKTYQQTLFSQRPEFEVHHLYLPLFKQWAVFDGPQLIWDFMKEKHRGAEFVNDVGVNCPEFARSKNTLKVTVLKKHLILTGVDNNQLCFYNSFFYDTENDMLFYILGSVKQLEQEPELLILDGLVNKHATIYHRLKQYFNQVEIAANPRNLHFSYLFDKLPDARFVTLFNSFVCA